MHHHNLLYSIVWISSVSIVVTYCLVIYAFNSHVIDSFLYDYSMLQESIEVSAIKKEKEIVTTDREAYTLLEDKTSWDQSVAPGLSNLNVLVSPGNYTHTHTPFLTIYVFRKFACYDHEKKSDKCVSTPKIRHTFKEVYIDGDDALQRVHVRDTRHFCWAFPGLIICTILSYLICPFCV